MEKIGRAKATGLSWKKIKGFVTCWPMWVFVIPYV
jgi:hypothetical protein